MADVRCGAAAHAGAIPHPSAAAVPNGLVARDGHPHRVPCGGGRRRRIHRQCTRHDPRSVDAKRPRALATRHGVREDGVLPCRHRRRSRLPHHGRPRVRARPGNRAPALVLHDRLADRVLADRETRNRLLRRVERDALCARSRHAAAAVDARAWREDHLERRDRGRASLHWGLRGPRLGARSEHGQDALGRGRERARLRDAGRRRRPCFRALVDRRLGDGVLGHRPHVVAPEHGLVRLLVARCVGKPRLLRLVQRRLLRRVRVGRPHRLGGRHGRPDLGGGRRRGRRCVRGQLLPPHRRRRRAERPRASPIRPRALRTGLRERDALTFSRLFTSLCSGAACRDTNDSQPPQAAAQAAMRRAAAGVAAAIALVVPAVAHATTAHDAALARKGITNAVKRHWVKAPEAQRYRVDVTRALRDVRVLPKLRGELIASQLSQLTPLWDSYTSPRALTLFSQLELNLDYFETHILPDKRIDVADDEGVIYRWFPRLGLEFHPLASFGALNNVAARSDADATRTLADALLARAIPRSDRLIWEYEFRFAGGRPPWASGMAQAVATQALARASALLQDTNLAAAAVRAYASVPPLLVDLPSGPWIRLYGFGGQVVLNAQLQAILSLLEYSNTSGDEEAAELVRQLDATTQALFARFDTGDWSRYQLGGAYATREYEKFVTDLLAKLARQTGDPFWATASQRFHAYYYDPPAVTQTAPPPEIWPQPLDGWLDTATIALSLSMRATLSVAIAGAVTTYRFGPGQHTITWKPPAGIAQGTYPVQVSAASYAGNRGTVPLASIVVHWETAPPPVEATFDGSTLSWTANDPGTPWLTLALDLVDPAAVQPQTLDLGRQGTSGSTVVR